MKMDLMANAAESANGSAARVLIVDDERDGATSLGKLLRLRGYAVEVVTDSTQCLSRLEAFEPDIVFLDIAMPGLSGYEIARRIRMSPRFEKIALVAVSGYADERHIAESLESGCDQHLVKPVDLATIESTLIHAVERRTQTLRNRHQTEGSPGNESSCSRK